MAPAAYNRTWSKSGDYTCRDVWEHEDLHIHRDGGDYPPGTAPSTESLITSHKQVCTIQTLESSCLYPHPRQRGTDSQVSFKLRLNLRGGGEGVSSQRYSQCRNRNWVTWSVPSIKERSVLLLYLKTYTFINTIYSSIPYSLCSTTLHIVYTKSSARHSHSYQPPWFQAFSPLLKKKHHPFFSTSHIPWRGFDHLLWPLILSPRCSRKLAVLVASYNFADPIKKV